MHEKMGTLNASLALSAAIPDFRAAYNIHRVTASAGRMTSLLHLITSAHAMAQ